MLKRNEHVLHAEGFWLRRWSLSYLVVEEVDDPGGPLPVRDDGGVGAEQAEQAQRRRLLHNVKGVATARERERRVNLRLSTPLVVIHFDFR